MRTRLVAPALALALVACGETAAAAPAPRVIDQMTTTTHCASRAKAVFAASREAILRWSKTAWLGRQAGLSAAVSDNLTYACKVQMAETDLAARLSPARLTLAQDRLVLASLRRLLSALGAKPGAFVNVTLWGGSGRTMDCIGLALSPTPKGEYARVLAGPECRPVVQIGFHRRGLASLAHAERTMQDPAAASAVHRAWAR